MQKQKIIDRKKFTNIKNALTFVVNPLIRSLLLPSTDKNFDFK